MTSEQPFSRNLRLLCSYEPSVSEVCRKLGINRQQFGKYLSGHSRPSPYNLQRIAEHFGIGVEELAMDHAQFRLRLQGEPPAGQRGYARRARPLDRVFSGNPRALRRYCGYYLIHCHSHSWPGHLVRGIARLWEEDGHVRSTSVERFREPVHGSFYRTKYVGQAAMLGSHIFIVEHQRVGNDAIVETVLDASPRSTLGMLNGITLGFSSRERKPYVSRSVWAYLGASVNLRATFGKLGIFAAAPGKFDPRVVSLLGAPVGSDGPA